MRALRQAIAAHLRANRGIACDARADLHRRRRAAGLPPDRLDAAQSRRQGVVREPGRDRRAQQPHRRRRRAGAGAGRRRGLRVDEGLRRAPHFRLAFVTPSHQQPLGSVMSLRAPLRAAAGRRSRPAPGSSRTTTTASSASAAPPLPTLKSVDATGLVIYVGTFSKSLFPSLRLGYLLAPPALVEHARTRS